MIGTGHTQPVTLLSRLKEATFFLAVYLYFTGFVYIYHYYAHFGISLYSLEIPFYYFFVYSFNVLLQMTKTALWYTVVTEGKLWTFGILILTITVSLMIVRRHNARQILTVSLLAWLFPFLFYVSYVAANLAAHELREGINAKRVTFVFKEDKDTEHPRKVLEGKEKGFAEALQKERAEEEARKQKEREAAQHPTPDSTAREPAAAATPPGQPPAPDTDSKKSAEVEALRRYLRANDRTGVELSETGGDVRRLPKLYIITETSDRFYVLFQHQSNTNPVKPLGHGFVFEVFKSDIILAQMETNPPYAY